MAASSRATGVCKRRGAAWLPAHPRGGISDVKFPTCWPTIHIKSMGGTLPVDHSPLYINHSWDLNERSLEVDHMPYQAMRWQEAAVARHRHTDSEPTHSGSGGGFNCTGTVPRRG